MKGIVVVMVALMVAGAAGAAEVSADSLTVDAVLARYVRVVGGEEALARVDLRSTRGRIVQDLTWSDPAHQETPFVASCSAGGELRYVEKPDWGELARAASDTGSVQDKVRWFLHPRYPLVVREFFPDLELKEVMVRDGRRVVALASPVQKFAYYALFFDLETGLLAHIGWHNEITDYRNVGGVLYPHRIVFGRKGGHTTYVVDEVRTAP